MAAGLPAGAARRKASISTTLAGFLLGEPGSPAMIAATGFVVVCVAYARKFA
jgi:hypothetical protein